LIQTTKAAQPANRSRRKSESRSLTETVTARLRDDILTCQWSPGARLRTMALCKEFGVSLAVVREALSKLTAEGLVTADPQRSFCVTPVSIAELEDLTWVRIQLDGLALREAIAKGAIDWETNIVAAFHRLSRTPHFSDATTRTKSEDWAQAHAAFHHALVSACGSPSLLQLREGLFARSERYRRLSGLIEGPRRDVEAEHRAIMDAALDRDAPLALSLLEGHLQLTTDLVRATFGSPS
jgi:DNA-binding GntR family transcriptional regulator